MVKKQQMRWSPRGAHLLLQVRTRVLNDDATVMCLDWHGGHPRERTTDSGADGAVSAPSSLAAAVVKQGAPRDADLAPAGHHRLRSARLGTAR